MDIESLLTRNSQNFPQQPAVIFQDKSISFEQLKNTVFKLANGLASLGIKSQDKVGIYLPNWPEYIYSYLALFCLGATVVPLDFMFTEEEMATCLNHSEAKYVIAKAKDIGVFKKLKEDVKTIKDIVLITDKIEGFRYFDDLIKHSDSEFKTRDIKDDDLSLILYTSGTTGRPKGIMLTYKHLDACPAAIGHFVDITNNDTMICALPFSHIAGLMYIQIGVYFSNKFILMERFNPLEFLKNVQKYKVTCFYLVPSMYYAILHLKEFEKFNLSSIRWVDVFGAPNNPEILRRFHQYCPHAYFLNGWGLTETYGPCVITPMSSEKLESVGKPAPWVDIKVVDDSGKTLPTGQIGEIIVRSWVVMKGYYKDEDETKKVMRNGWFYTGDLGRFDKEGFLYILGRKKEMIKVSGEIVYTGEVESVIARHPLVKEVAVVGVSDNLRGEVVKAVVVLQPEAALKEEDIRYFSKEHLAHFKVPHIVEFRQELPKNRVGKVDKTQLK
ncbi:MAG: AMP-binding protein [Candidatus Omnitrophica bacterium]|nr:AMP-binding protein [Candidatus Omnitrophota bacterium]MDD5351694.1 AMP-binding protein [Candidatus Omnitrophota bacterium]MDD5550904.1 AMP-binding protein [Candidatus Omnitrophota bacterium]